MVMVMVMVNVDLYSASSQVSNVLCTLVRREQHESCSPGCCCIEQHWLFIHITWRGYDQ